MLIEADWDEQNDFRIERIIGEGGMGKVYLATELALDRLVAIKVAKHSGRVAKPNVLLKEARALAKLNHPNIVQILSIREYHQEIWMIMEYVNGRTLAHSQLVKNASQLQQLKWLYEIAKGLTAAHNKGYLHCDLKLSNILVDERNTAKIADFGVAKLSNVHEDSSSHFISLSNITPEAITGEGLSEHTDLYCFALLAFELLAGYPLISISPKEIQASSKEQLLAKLNTVPDIINSLPNIPIEISSMLKQLLSIEKEARYFTADQVRARCKSVLINTTSSDLMDTFPNPFANNELEVTYSQNHQPIDGFSYGSHSDDSKNLEQNKYESQRQFRKIEKRRKSQWLKRLLGKQRLSILSRYLLIVIVPATLIITYCHSTFHFNNVRIAVIPPTIKNDDSVSRTQVQLMEAAIDSAAREFISQNRQFRLIAFDEISTGGLDLVSIAKSTAVDELLTTSIHCENSICEAEIRRIDPNLTIKSFERWPVHYKSHRDLLSTVQLQMKRIFATSSDLNNRLNTLSDSELISFLNIYYQVRFGSKSSVQLEKELFEFIQQHNNIDILYSLYREVALNLYHETRQEKELARLEKLLINAPNRYKDTLNYQVNLFWLALNQADNHKARSSISKIQTLSSDPAIAYELNAQYFYHNSQFENASDYFKKAIQLRPSIDLQFNLSLTLWWQGNTDEAIRTLEQIINTLPNDYRANRLLASFHLFTGQFESAIEGFKKALAQHFQGTDQNNLAIAYLLLGEYEHAYGKLKSLVEHQPSNPTWRLNWADTLWVQNKRTQAAEEYKTVIELNKDKLETVSALLQNAQAYVRLEQNRPALEALQVAKQKAPENLDVYFTAAAVHTSLKDTQSALYFVELAIEQGMGVRWFDLPRFDPLCSEPEFQELMSLNNNAMRCN